MFDKEVTGVYMSDMVSDMIANAKAGNLLVTVQIHNNVIAAANLVDIAAIIVTQGKQPGGSPACPNTISRLDCASDWGRDAPRDRGETAEKKIISRTRHRQS